MFVIVTYDIGAKRVSKVMKTCRKYLNHVQKSVFEGTITESTLKRMQSEIMRIIEIDEDQVCIYKLASVKYTQKEVVGSVEKMSSII